MLCYQLLICKYRMYANIIKTYHNKLCNLVETSINVVRFAIFAFRFPLSLYH